MWRIRTLSGIAPRGPGSASDAGFASRQLHVLGTQIQAFMRLAILANAIVNAALPSVLTSPECCA
jgi:hypothetical protein